MIRVMQEHFYKIDKEMDLIKWTQKWTSKGGAIIIKYLKK